ncbi:unnamed protein product [Paramecium pentaurelia]|uniref:Uncharacterized protein n=1 Tax=Paramecium pentaurelia TaxID=43138 RepID=A0A8S1VSL0_9CILI|nr:unnamed protein product [Paramecium pentaurelia]
MYQKRSYFIFLSIGKITSFQKQDLIDDQKITKNLVKINHFKWKGKEGKEKQKIGKWEGYWKNKVQKIGGYYDNQGLKQGLWYEEYENFWDYAQIVYVGIYHNGIQRNRWDTIMNNNIIGGGNYDHNGKKTGKWVELHLNYFKQNYVYCDATYEGEYLDGIKQGYWQTFLSKKIIGGGFYNQVGQKDGFWIELNDNFSLYLIEIIHCGNQVIYKGNYKNGLQIGIWEIVIVYDGKQIYIGGGSFDDNGKKNGRWVDLAIDWLNGNKEIFYIGDYKNGQKIGQWNIHNWYNKSIGGGEFQEGIKDGIWIDVHDDWRPGWRQIIYHGEYQMRKKIGTWKILENSDKQISGGDYNEYGMKNGKWFEPDEKWDKKIWNSFMKVNIRMVQKSVNGIVQII